MTKTLDLYTKQLYGYTVLHYGKKNPIKISVLTVYATKLTQLTVID
jgi:hypothetical protein